MKKYLILLFVVPLLILAIVFLYAKFFNKASIVELSADSFLLYGQVKDINEDSIQLTLFKGDIDERIESVSLRAKPLLFSETERHIGEKEYQAKWEQYKKQGEQLLDMPDKYELETIKLPNIKPGSEVRLYYAKDSNEKKYAQKIVVLKQSLEIPSELNADAVKTIEASGQIETIGDDVITIERQSLLSTDIIQEKIKINDATVIILKKLKTQAVFAQELENYTELSKTEKVPFPNKYIETEVEADYFAKDMFVNIKANVIAGENLAIKIDIIE